MGRFTQEDIYRGNSNNPKSLNRYMYVYSNPINYVDKSGFRPVEVATVNTHTYKQEYATTKEDLENEEKEKRKRQLENEQANDLRRIQGMKEDGISGLLNGQGGNGNIPITPKELEEAVSYCLELMENGFDYSEDALDELGESIELINQIEINTYTKDLPDGIMAVSEKIRHIPTYRFKSGGKSPPLFAGTAIVYDEEKYGVYFIIGIAPSIGVTLPALPNFTTGLGTIIEYGDYTNAFITVGTQAGLIVESISTMASNEKAVTYVPEYGLVPGASTGSSFSWYFPLFDDWKEYEEYDELPEGYLYRDDLIDYMNENNIPFNGKVYLGVNSILD